MFHYIPSTAFQRFETLLELIFLYFRFKAPLKQAKRFCCMKIIQIFMYKVTNEIIFDEIKLQKPRKSTRKPYGDFVF